jgi:hypothetical protein
MRHIILSVVVLFAVSAVAADEFPLTLRVLGLSETAREYKRLAKDPCVQVGMGAPCRGYEDIPSPGWAIDVLTVTGRVTQRGRTVEYQLECRTAAGKRPCAPMRYGNYPARWNGKRLEVQVTDGKGKGTINRFEVKGELAADVD